MSGETERPAEWELIYQALRGRSPGDVVTYADLSRALGRDFTANRAPLAAARQRLAADGHAGLENVRGAGYALTPLPAPGAPAPAAASALFAPRGDRAQWRVIYDVVRGMEPGQVISYAQLTGLLGRDFLADRGPLARAMKELETADHRTLACERGTGYRIARADEHEQLARAHTARSRRQMTKAVARARSANRAELTPEQAQRLSALEVQLSQHAQMMRRLAGRDEDRAAQLRQLRRDTTADIAGLSTQLDNLTDVLRRHGIQVPAALPAGTPGPGPASPAAAHAP